MTSETFPPKRFLDHCPPGAIIPVLDIALYGVIERYMPKPFAWLRPALFRRLLPSLQPRFERMPGQYVT